MFNLFGNKNGNSTVAVKTTTYPKVVDEIHNEFFTAGDSILQEATCLLKDLEQQDLSKGKRLAALGFNKTREAVVAIETENKVATTKEIADLVIHYRINYPNNKFITEEQVKYICEKYSLVCGETSMYKGFVPESKLSVVEKFKVNKKDGNILYNYGSSIKTLEDWYNSNSIGFVENIVKVEGKIEVGIKSMKICAPLKDMEIPQGKEVKGYKIQDIPDPVVLQPVHGGYLIVCAWGDEATDEIVVNQANN